MKKCYRCGRDLASANKRFCQYCGAPAQPTAAQRNTGMLPQPVWEPTRPAGKSRTRVGLLIAGGIAVVVVAIVVVFVVRGRTDSTSGTAVASGLGTTTSQAPFQLPPLNTTTDEPPPDFSSDVPTTDASDPATVVTQFYAAINAHDYQTAWALGGQNLGSSYTVFANGFATTVSDGLTIVGTSGNAVTVDLIAQWADGTSHEYQGAYTVANGQIISGTLHKIS